MNMKRGLFIINPSSGRQNILDTVESIIGKLVMREICDRVEVFYTKGKDDAKLRAMELMPGQYDFVVAVGGDGTLNEVAAGLYLSKSNIPLAVISAGTVNDFANYLSLPQTPEPFVDMIEKFECLSVDLGKVNEEYFINVVAGGMLTDIAYKVPKDKKAAMGKMAYYLEFIAEFPKQLLDSGIKLHVESEEFTGDTDAIVFIITNTKSVGGVANALPLASVEDGLLDVMILKRVNPLTTPDAIVKFLQSEHYKAEDIEYFQTKKVRIEQIAGTPIVLDFDGEVLVDNLPAEISVIEDAIQIIMP
ncbi:MAG: diacylglycerol kinase family lipid kinase [Lachnospiraceae bacterium]|nr:diacylglycerol kinase family lipid kinase [Lachnospiraceae bacterium]